MVLSELVLALLIAISGLILAILVGSLGSKYVGQLTLLSIGLFAVALPIVLSFLYIHLVQYVVIMDWPYAGGRYAIISPLTAIFVASWSGGVLGLYAGKIWGEERDKSCLQCMLVPFFLIFIGILIIAVLP